MLDIKHDPQAHRLSTQLEGHTALLDYELKDREMLITHTRVPQPIGGRGVAAELMRSALEVATSSGWTVRPVCSYAVTYMQRHAVDRASQHLEELLDEALDESFPASDSPSVGGTT